MDAKEMTRTVEPEPRNQRRGLLVAAAAFALVLVLAVGVVLVNRNTGDLTPSDTTPPTTQAAPSTTVADTPATTVASNLLTDEETATIDALVTAANSGDWEAWSALHDPGFLVTGFPGPENTTSPLEPWLAMYQSHVEAQSTVEMDCRRAESGEVLCSEQIAGPLWTAIFYQPLSNTIRYEIADGVIIGAVWRCNLCLFEGEAYYTQSAAIVAWVETVDADEAALMGDAPQDGTNELWAKWAAAWLEAGRP